MSVLAEMGMSQAMQSAREEKLLKKALREYIRSEREYLCAKLFEQGGKEIVKLKNHRGIIATYSVEGGDRIVLIN